MSPKMGRPTNNPKPYKIAVRLDEKTNRILAEYCLQKEVTKNEAVRKGIELLEDELKK